MNGRKSGQRGGASLVFAVFAVFSLVSLALVASALVRGRSATVAAGLERMRMREEAGKALAEALWTPGPTPTTLTASAKTGPSRRQKTPKNWKTAATGFSSS